MSTEETIHASVTCHTQGCVLADRTLDIEYTGVLICGGCDVAIEDIIREGVDNEQG